MASHQKLTEQESSVTSNPNRRTHRRAGLATVAAATAALALAACAPSNNVDATPEPVETSTSTPAPEFEGANPEDFIIPAGLDAEAAAEAVMEGAITDWNNAGANDSLRDRVLSSDGSFDSVLSEVAAENKQIVVDNLFVEDWESNGSLVALANGGEKTNFENLQWYTSTAWSSEEPENIEGFRSWLEVTAVQELDDGDGDPNTRLIKLDYTDNTNSDKNTGPDRSKPSGTAVVGLVSDGNQERISNFEFIA